MSGSRIQKTLGFYRSKMIYLWMPGRQRRMRKLYRHFIGPGSLCFDIGSHLGNRVQAWRSLGAVCVAVEPQARFAGYLRQKFSPDFSVTVLDNAVGDKPGERILYTSDLTPTVSSLSASWVGSIGQKDKRFSAIRWQGKEAVKVITLDKLIEQFGVPDFCKIDVEGYEFRVLAGLSTPVPALSFEYLPATLDDTFRCLERLLVLSPDYRFNFSRKESMSLVLNEWVDASQLKRILRRLPHGDPSGDIYGKITPPL